MSEPDTNGASNGRQRVAGHPNLRAWPKGVSGNPKGREAGVISYAEWIRKIREDFCSKYVWAIHECERLELDPDVTKVGELIAQQSIAFSLTGNAAYMHEVNERADGKVPQHLDVAAVPIEGFQVQYQRPILADDSEHSILPDGGPAAIS